jgi:hypothetical protein
MSAADVAAQFGDLTTNARLVLADVEAEGLPD